MLHSPRDIIIEAHEDKQEYCKVIKTNFKQTKNDWIDRGYIP